MKIINLIQKPQLRGAEIFACQLSKHLVAQGHEVLVVTIFKGDTQLPYAGSVVHLERPLFKRLFDLTGWKAFAQICRNFQPHIVQANATDTLKFVVSSHLLFGWKSKIVFRNANKISDFIDSKIKHHLNKFYLSKVDFVISVSQACQRDFIKTFSYLPEKIETVEVGVEEVAINGLPEDLAPLFAAGPVIVNIAGFAPEKNHAGLVRIFEKVLQNHPKTQLALVGRGKLEKAIHESVHKKGLTPNVHFLGYRNDVLEILRHATIFAIPSHIEGLPATILEAMYCETPVVAYNVGGIHEVVTEETGWLIKKNDEVGFTTAVSAILQGSAGESEKTKKAKQCIENHFLNKHIAKRFIAVYNRVLQASSCL